MFYPLPICQLLLLLRPIPLWRAAIAALLPPPLIPCTRPLQACRSTQSPVRHTILAAIQECPITTTHSRHQPMQTTTTTIPTRTIFPYKHCRLLPPPAKYLRRLNITLPNERWKRMQPLSLRLKRKAQLP